MSSSAYNLYLSGHRNPINRLLHVAGWVLLLVCMSGAVLLSNWLLAGAGIAGAYGLAWLGHFVFERNVPASFRDPLFSGRASLRLFLSIVFGKMRISDRPE